MYRRITASPSFQKVRRGRPQLLEVRDPPKFGRAEAVWYRPQAITRACRCCSTAEHSADADSSAVKPSNS
jgi:hypothetical protein